MSRAIMLLRELVLEQFLANLLEWEWTRMMESVLMGACSLRTIVKAIEKEK